MVLFNYTSKELTAKIVYYGPGLCGKTTNLQFIYDNLPAHVKKGKMLSLATKTDRTLFFDFLPIELGKIRGMKTRVQLYTVPGQVFYNSTRKLVLKGADGLVFVADSQQKMMESNAESYRNLEENLKEIGLKLDEIPLVMQFNKRDLPHLASVEEMNTLVNRHNAPFYEAVATTGIGVEDTLKAVTKLVLNHLAKKYNLGVAPEASEAPGAETTADPSWRDAGKGIAVATDPGALEIERSPSVGPPMGSDPEASAEAGADEDLGGHEGLFAQEEPEILQDEEPFPEPSVPGDGRSAAAETENLEMVDLEEAGGSDDFSIPDAPGGLSPGPVASEDLSDLLEELPAELGDESRISVEEPVPDFIPRKVPSPSSGKTSPRTAPPDPLQMIPEAPLEAPRAAGSSATSPGRGSVISPVDPLGIAGGRKAAPPAARAIQVGSVIPGREHEITVPLELSVDGHRLRLNLKMTLVLSR